MGWLYIHDATLHRFYSLHFAFPFLIFIISIIHIIFLHEFGSSNPLGIVIVTDLSYLSPYFLLKDFFGIILASIVFMGVIFYVPDLFSHSINYEIANFLVTPTHIVPEWYFMFFYAILRS
jgi:quinol-cytochrome oxidoreductase complex cytochrome b subunit